MKAINRGLSLDSCMKRVLSIYILKQQEEFIKDMKELYNGHDATIRLTLNTTTWYRES